MIGYVGTFLNGLLLNVALMVSAAVLYTILTYKIDREKIWLPALQGALFGLASVAVMSVPVKLVDGVIFDTRAAILANVALFLGFVPALIAGAIAAFYRLWLGGGGAAVGVVNVVIALLGGLTLRTLLRGDIHNVSIDRLALLGLGVSLLAIVSFALLPLDYVRQVLQRLAPSYIVAITLGTMVLGWLMQRFRVMRAVDSILEEEEARFRTLFETSSSALILADVTRLLDVLDRMRRSGQVDLREVLERNPPLASRIKRSIRLVDANPAALDLFGVRDVNTLSQVFQDDWDQDRLAALIDSMVKTLEGRRIYTGRLTLTRRDGSSVPVAFSYPLPRSQREASRLPMTFLDLSRLQQAEASLEAERKRLDEILWATDVGTWEWWIATGETRFNERWADIIGYSLAELQPVSFATWERFAHPLDLERSNRELAKVYRREVDHYSCEVRMRHKDGRWVWILDRGKVLEWDQAGNPIRMSGTHADITVQKVALLRLERSAAIRKAVSRAQLASMSSAGEETLSQEICEILVEAGDYRVAWLGLPDTAQPGQLRIVGKAGASMDLLQAVEDRLRRGDSIESPAVRAFRTAQAVVLRGRGAADLPEELNELLTQATISVTASLPVTASGQIIAILTVCAAQEDELGAEEISLLQEFTGYLALAIRNMRTERRAQRVTDALARSALSAVAAIAKTLEKRDPYTSGHQDRVAQLSVAIAQRLGWDAERIEGLRLGALIHDIGKIYVPAEILNRPGRLTENEMAIIRTHPGVGADILSESDFPWPLQDMIEQHHERMDGSGYPKGLTGDAIIPEARVIAVADVVESIGSHRPYRPSLGIEAGLEEIAKGRGTTFDAQVVDACIAVVREDGFQYQPTEGRRA